ncbi:MAG: hypothetical protein K1X65_10885 [Caldilineales bacterium]|nr:hypothetical protein [Caldilineales bacterium]MCW5856718.1 hypothetical protein [Caldilineales bacterium]
MCGIAGIVLHPLADASDLPHRLRAMSAAVAHRGPDDEGCYLAPDGRLGLINRRLAIRDLSPAGHMPMAAEDGRVWVTYNGEIYNAGELRQELEAAGWLRAGATEGVWRDFMAGRVHWSRVWALAALGAVIV